MYNARTIEEKSSFLFCTVARFLFDLTLPLFSSSICLILNILSFQIILQQIVQYIENTEAGPQSKSQNKATE